MPLADDLISDMLSGSDSVVQNLTEVEKVILRGALQQYTEEGRSEVADLLWRIDFKERPPTPQEFMTNKDYLGEVCPGLAWQWRRDLQNVLDPPAEIVEWILDGALGTGKTTVSCIALAYKLCLMFHMRSPAQYYGLLPNSPVVLALFNVYKYLGQDVAYAKLLSLMQTSPYFKKMSDLGRGKRRVKEQYHEFPGNVGLVIGSDALHSMGQDVVGGLLDEANFRKKSASGVTDDTKRKEMFQIYVGTLQRIISRVGQPVLLCLASSSEDEDDFTSKHKEEMRDDPHVYVSHYALYEIKERYREEKVFWVFTGDRINPPRILGDEEASDGDVIPVPQSLRPVYETDVEESLRKISGVSVQSSGRLIPDRRKILAAVERAGDRKNPFTEESVQIGVRSDKCIEDFVRVGDLFLPLDVAASKYQPKFFPSTPRYIHVDLAETKCAAGIACSCQSGVTRVSRLSAQEGTVDVSEVLVHIDFILQIRNLEGDRIDFGKIRRFIFWLRAMGMNISLVTYDQYQSSDSINILTQAGIEGDRQSMDKTPDAYFTLRNLYQEDRVSHPYHSIYQGEVESLRIRGEGMKEKVVKGEGKGKDVSDSVAGSVYRCVSGAKGSVVAPPMKKAVAQAKGVYSQVGENPWDTRMRGGKR